MVFMRWWYAICTYFSYYKSFNNGWFLWDDDSLNDGYKSMKIIHWFGGSNPPRPITEINIMILYFYYCTMYDSYLLIMCASFYLIICDGGIILVFWF